MTIHAIASGMRLTSQDYAQFLLADRPTSNPMVQPSYQQGHPRAAELAADDGVHELAPKALRHGIVAHAKLRGPYDFRQIKCPK
jgi:hypothetical protein